MKVPETWQLVRLSSVCIINPSLAMEERPTPDALVSFIPMAAVDEIEGKITRRETRTFQEVSKGFTPFRENDVLFAKITPSMENGKAAIATDLENGLGFGSTEFHVLRPIDHLLPNYLLYFIRQPWFRNYARTAFVGSAGQQRVPQDFLERVQLPLPTLPEQQRIVAMLRQADELRRLRREAIEQAQRLPVTLFLEMFGDPVTNPKRWKIIKVRETGRVQLGRQRAPQYQSGNFSQPYVRVANVFEDRIDITDVLKMDFDEHDFAQYRLQFGDILLNEGQSTELVGRPAMWRDEIKDCCFQNTLIRFQANGPLTNPDYALALFLNYFRAGQFAKISSKTSSVAHLGAGRFAIMPFLLPPKQLQDDFSRKWETIRELKNRNHSSLLRYNELLQSFQQSAFSGDLTSVWRNFHLHELESAARARDAILGQTDGKAVITEDASAAHRELPQPERYWLTNHLGEVQGFVWQALREWPGTLIPSEDLDTFRQSADQMEQVEDANDHILRALSQLAGLGFIAQVSVPNQQGEYVVGYRGLREDERVLPVDLQTVLES